MDEEEGVEERFSSLSYSMDMAGDAGSCTSTCVLRNEASRGGCEGLDGGVEGLGVLTATLARLAWVGLAPGARVRAEDLGVSAI